MKTIQSILFDFSRQICHHWKSGTIEVKKLKVMNGSATMRPKLEKTALTQSTRSQKSHKASSRSCVSRSKLQALSCQGATKASNLQFNTAISIKNWKKDLWIKPQFCLHFSLSLLFSWLSLCFSSPRYLPTLRRSHFGNLRLERQASTSMIGWLIFSRLQSNNPGKNNQTT